MTSTAEKSRRGTAGRFTRSPETAQRDAHAARLRTAHLSYPQIAVKLGYANPSGAYKAVQRAMKAVVSEPGELALSLALGSLDELDRRANEVLKRAHVTVSQGRIVREDDGRPLLDDGPVLQAIGAKLRIMEQRAKLCGMYAPVRSAVTVTDSVSAEIERLAGILGVGQAVPSE